MKARTKQLKALLLMHVSDVNNMYGKIQLSAPVGLSFLVDAAAAPRMIQMIGRGLPSPPKPAPCGWAAMNPCPQNAQRFLSEAQRSGSSCEAIAKRLASQGFNSPRLRQKRQLQMGNVIKLGVLTAKKNCPSLV